MLAEAGGLGPCVEDTSWWHLFISLSWFFLHPSKLPCSLGSLSKLYIQSLPPVHSFGPLALYSPTPPSTSPSSLPPLDWSRQLSYLPGKDQKTLLRAMGPSPRKRLRMVTRQVGAGVWLDGRAGWEAGEGRPTRNLSFVSPSWMGFRKQVGYERVGV